MQAANARVRLNSLLLLLLFFPLHSPSLGRQLSESLLARQLSLLSRLLVDPLPAIRMAAVTGLSDALAQHWAFLPLPAVQHAVVTVTEGLMADASSPAVRLAAVRGVRRMVEGSRDCHEGVRGAMGRVAAALWDKSRAVREEAADVLDFMAFNSHVKLKEVRGRGEWNMGGRT